MMNTSYWRFRFDVNRVLANKYVTIAGRVKELRYTHLSFLEKK